MHERSALHLREDGSIEIFGETIAAHDDSAAGTAKRFMSRARNEFRLRYRRRMLAGCYKPGDVRDIDHHHRSGFFRDFGDSIEIDNSWIRAGPNDDQFGFVLFGQTRQFVIIDHFRILAYSVWHDAIVLSGEIQRVTVGEMAAMRQVHSQHRIAGLQDGKIDRHIGLASRMRLNIHVLGAEEFLCARDREVLDHIDELTTAVVAAARIPFGVLICKHGTRCFKNTPVREIFRSDQFQTSGLPPFFIFDSGVDFRIEFFQGSINTIHADLALVGGRSRRLDAPMDGAPRCGGLPLHSSTLCYNFAPCLA